MPVCPTCGMEGCEHAVYVPLADRVREVVEANRRVDANGTVYYLKTQSQMADEVGCDQKTISNAVTNKENSSNVTDPPLLNLKDMYADDVPYWTQRPVKAVEAALQECSREQLAYLFSEVLPIFHLNLRKGNVK